MSGMTPVGIGYRQDLLNVECRINAKKTQKSITSCSQQVHQMHLHLQTSDQTIVAVQTAKVWSRKLLKVTGSDRNDLMNYPDELY